jgi:hypothetical protein
MVVTLLCIIPNAAGMKLMQNKLNLFLETGETYKEQLRGTIGYMSPKLILSGGLLVHLCGWECESCLLPRVWCWNAVCKILKF